MSSRHKPASVEFIYLYRDASNYKRWGSVVFQRRGADTLRQMRRRVELALMQDNTFIAAQVRLPEVFLYNETPGTDDHCMHEFHDLIGTAESPNDPHQRFIEELIMEFEAAAARGWVGFHYDSQGRRKSFRLSEL